MTTVDARRTVNALRALACRYEAGDVAITPDGLICVYLQDAPPVSVNALLAAIPDPVVDFHARDVPGGRLGVSGELLTMRLFLDLRLAQAVAFDKTVAVAA